MPSVGLMSISSDCGSSLQGAVTDETAVHSFLPRGVF